MVSLSEFIELTANFTCDFAAETPSGLTYFASTSSVVVPRSYWLFISKKYAILEAMLNWWELDKEVTGLFASFFSVAHERVLNREILLNIYPCAQARVYPDKVINFSMSADDLNIYHFILNVIPKLTIIEFISNGKNLPLLFGYHPSPLQLSILRELKIENPIAVIEGSDPHVVRNRKSYEFAQVYSVFYTRDYGLRLKEIKKLFRRQVPPVKLGTKIYINRKDAHGSGRILSNQAEVERILRSHGFVSITMSDFTFAQQLALFRYATNIVFEHGAAGIFLLFCDSRPQICELLSPLNCTTSQEVASHYKDLCGYCDLNYTAIVGDMIENRSVIHFEISISKLSAYLVQTVNGRLS
jgi:capsular polysaccharide biosynthesis protein